MSYFSYVGKLFSNVKGFYNEINAATLTGAIDTIIVQQEDGTFLSSPFHVRFGKIGVLRAREKRVDIEINGKPVDLQMKLGESGEAFFVTELEDEEDDDVESYLATSPIPSSANLMELGLQEMKEQYMSEEGSLKKKYINEAGNKVEIITKSRESGSEEGKGSESDVDKKGVTFVLDEVAEELKKKKSRRKRRGHKKAVSGESGKNIDDEIFNMDDVSSDEELANLPPMTSNHESSKFHKSISLPTMEETKFQRTKQWASTQFTPFKEHPFSDTDMSPLVSPSSTRPPSPKSDTEVDRQKSGEVDSSILMEEDNTLWEWGDLPRRSVSHTPIAENEQQQSKSQSALTDEQQSSNSLFQFMKKTKKVRHKPEVEGIYLDDLNLEEMDPEVAKLYFPKKFHSQQFVSIRERVENDEDTESGRGPSLPVSPHSVEGAIGGPPVSFLHSEVKSLGNFSLSLCGGLSDRKEVTLDKFMQHIVTFQDLCDDCGMISNPDLVVRVGDKYYNWQTAAPMVLAQVVFGQKLPDETINKLIQENMPKKKKERRSWFSWGRAAEETPTGGIQVAPTSDTEISVSKSESLISPPASSPASLNGSPRKNNKRKITDESTKSEMTDDSDSEKNSPKSNTTESMQKSHDKMKKTLRLSSEQIGKLNLQEGQNDITFSVTTQYQGTTRCTSHIYLWRYDDKIIVSDIDGTITKSDVLGQILPIIGKDWSQSGVAQLFTHIANNGYKFLYLSARAIGQSKVTKDLLRSIKQELYVLPDGPLLLSPTSLVSAFHREVIERKPEEFKIACLKDIGDLFPGRQAFFAGFGNKINDVYAYKAITIPSHHIFTINHRGLLKQESSYTFQSSYTSLSDIADHFFPPIERGHIANEFSGSQYWRQPLPVMCESEMLRVIRETEETDSVK
ncbi:hypothetical protein FSP39_024180 [Pinctada imbricata]|uniref:phosphatidate phosphatase n=1 Tax=Pinctada imbricata TaxID=66713 RepID=A0AA88XXA9_PINIB|nr:hypothetical protein FSP39_024180 [Pinctada imbricata]